MCCGCFLNPHESSVSESFYSGEENDGVGLCRHTDDSLRFLITNVHLATECQGATSGIFLKTEKQFCRWIGLFYSQPIILYLVSSFVDRDRDNHFNSIISIFLLISS